MNPEGSVPDTTQESEAEELAEVTYLPDWHPATELDENLDPLAFLEEFLEGGTDH